VFRQKNGSLLACSETLAQLRKPGITGCGERSYLNPLGPANFLRAREAATLHRYFVVYFGWHKDALE